MIVKDDVHKCHGDGASERDGEGYHGDYGCNVVGKEGDAVKGTGHEAETGATAGEGHHAVDSGVMAFEELVGYSKSMQ